MYALNVVKILCLIHVAFVPQSSSQPNNKSSHSQFCFFATSELIYENVMQQVASSAKCEGGGKLLDNKVSLGGVQGSVDDFDSVWGAVYSVDETDYPCILRYAQSRSQLNFMSQTRVTVQGTRTPSICRTVDVGIISSAFPFTSQSEATFQTSVAQYIERLRQLGASERYVRKFNTAQKWMPASFGSNPSQSPVQTPPRRRVTFKTMNQKTSKASSSNPLSHRNPTDVTEQEETQSTTSNKLNSNAKKIVKVEKIKQSNDDLEQTTIVTQKVSPGEAPQHQITTVISNDDGSMMTTSVSNSPALMKPIPNIMEGGLQHPIVPKYFDNQPTQVEPGRPLTSPKPLPLTDKTDKIIDKYGRPEDPKPLLPQSNTGKPYDQYPPTAKIESSNQPMWQPNSTPPVLKQQEMPMLPKNDGLIQPSNRVPQFSKPENLPTPIQEHSQPLSSPTTFENTPKETLEKQIHRPKDFTPLTKDHDQLENVGENQLNKFPHRPIPLQNISESSEEDDTTVSFANNPRQDFTTEDVGKPVQNHLPQSPSPDPSSKNLEIQIPRGPNPMQNNPELQEKELENPTLVPQDGLKHPVNNPTQFSQQEKISTPIKKCSTSDLPQNNPPETLDEKLCNPQDPKSLPHQRDSPQMFNPNQPPEKVYDKIKNIPEEISREWQRPLIPTKNEIGLIQNEVQNPTMIEKDGPRRPFNNPLNQKNPEMIENELQNPKVIEREGPRRPVQNPLHQPNNPELMENELQNPQMIEEDGPRQVKNSIQKQNSELIENDLQNHKMIEKDGPRRLVNNPLKQPNNPEMMENELQNPQMIQEDGPRQISNPLQQPNTPELIENELQNPNVIEKDGSRRPINNPLQQPNTPELIENELQNPKMIEKDGPRRPINNPLQQPNTPKVIENELQNPQMIQEDGPRQINNPLQQPNPELIENELQNPKMIEKDGSTRPMNNPLQQPNPELIENELQNPKTIQEDGPRRLVNNPLQQPNTPKVIENELQNPQMIQEDGPRQINNPLQQPNPELIENELQNPKKIQKECPRQVNNPLQQPNTPKVIENELQNPQMIKEDGPRQINNPLQQPNTPEFIENELQNPKKIQKDGLRQVNNPLQQPNPELIENELQNPKRIIQEDGPRHLVNNPLQQPNTPELIENELQNPKMIEKDGPRRLVNNPLQQSNPELIENELQNPKKIQKDGLRQVNNPLQQPNTPKVIENELQNPQMIKEDGPRQINNPLQQPNPELIENELQNPKRIIQEDGPRHLVNNPLQQPNTPELIENELQNPKMIEKDGPKRPINNPLQQPNTELIEQELKNLKIIEKDCPRRLVNNPLQQPNNPELIENELQNPKMIEKDGLRQPVNSPLQQQNPELIKNELQNPKEIEKDGPRRPVNNPLQQEDGFEEKLDNPRGSEYLPPQNNFPKLSTPSQVCDPRIPRRPNPMRDNPELLDKEVENPMLEDKIHPKRPINNLTQTPQHENTQISIEKCSPLDLPQDESPELLQEPLCNPKDPKSLLHQKDSPELSDTNLLPRKGYDNIKNTPEEIPRELPGRFIPKQSNPELIKNQLQNPNLIQEDGPRNPINSPLQENNPELIENELQNPKTIEKDGPRRPVNNPLDQRNNPELIENELQNPQIIQEDGPRQVKKSLQQNSELIENKLQNRRMIQEGGQSRLINNPLQQTNPELIENELQNPETIQRDGPRRPVNNPLDQPNNPELVENELQNPPMIQEDGPRRVKNSLQQKNPELIENELRNPGIIQEDGPRRVKNSIQQNSDLIENKLQNPKRIQEDGPRRPINNPLQQPNPKLIENEMQNPKLIEKDCPRRLVNNPLQQPNNPELIENELQNPQIIQEKGPKQVEDSLQQKNPELIENELQNPKMIEEDGPLRQVKNSLQQQNPEMIEHESQNPQKIQKNGLRRPVNNSLQKPNPELIENELQDPKMIQEDGPRRPINKPLRQEDNSPTRLDEKYSEYLPRKNNSPELSTPNQVCDPRKPRGPNPMQDNPELLEKELENPMFEDKDYSKLPTNNPTQFSQQENTQVPTKKYSTPDVSQDNPPEILEEKLRNPEDPESLPYQKDSPELLNPNRPVEELYDQIKKTPKEITRDLPRQPIQNNPQTLEEELENPMIGDKDGLKRPVNNPSQFSEKEIIQTPTDKFSVPPRSAPEIIEENLRNPKDSNLLPRQKSSSELFRPTQSQDIPDLSQEKVENSMLTNELKPKQSNNIQRPSTPTSLQDILEKGIHHQVDVEQNLSPEYTNQSPTKLEDTPSNEKIMDQLINTHQPMKAERGSPCSEDFKEPLLKYSSEPDKPNPTKCEDTLFNQQVHEQSSNTFRRTSRDSSRKSIVQQNNSESAEPTLLNDRPIVQAEEAYDQPSQEMLHRSPRSLYDSKTFEERKENPTLVNKDGPTQSEFSNLDNPRELPSQTPKKVQSSQDLNLLSPQNKPLQKYNQAPTKPKDGLPSLQNTPEDQHPKNPNPMPLQEDPYNLHDPKPQRMFLNKDDQPLNTPQKSIHKAPEEATQDTLQSSEEDDLENSSTKPTNINPMQDGSQGLVQENTKKALKKIQLKSENPKNLKNKASQPLPQQSNLPQPLIQQLEQEKKKAEMNLDETIEEILSTPKQNAVCTTVSPGQTTTVISNNGNAPTILVNGQPVTSPGLSNSSPSDSPPLPVLETVDPEVGLVPNSQKEIRKKNPGSLREEIPNTNSKLNSQETNLSRRTKQTQNRESITTETEIMKSNPKHQLGDTDTPNLQSLPTRELLGDEGNSYLDSNQRKPKNLDSRHPKFATEGQKQISNSKTSTGPQLDSNDSLDQLPNDKTSIPGFTVAQLVPEYNVLTRANRPTFIKENTASSAQTSKRNTAKVGTQTTRPTRMQGTATSMSIATSNNGVAKPPMTLEKILTPNTNSNTPVVTTTPISTPNAKGMNIQVQSPNGMASTTHITSNDGDGPNQMSVVSVSSSSGQPQTTTNLVVNGNPIKSACNSAAVSSSTTTAK